MTFRRVLVLTAALALVAAGSVPANAMPVRPDLLDPANPALTITGAPVVTVPPWVDQPAPVPAGGQRGTKRVLLICIRFSDLSYNYATTTFRDMVFGPWSPSSVNDYYQQISYGNLSLTGSAVGWYTAAHNRAYYGAGQAGIGAYPNNTASLVAEAVQAAETGGVDFSQYDNDGDGMAESIWVIHCGEGYETSLDTNDILSHNATMSGMGDPSAPYTYDGVLVDRYLCVPELQDASPLTHVKIGVYCHEYGHMLGLPDLYDVGRHCTTISSHGVGVYDLMAYGGWGGNVQTPERPAHMSAWSKIQLGWLTPTVVSSPVTGQTLAPVETNPVVLKLGASGFPSEYYLLSYRDNTVGFDQGLPGTGLCIWHVDDQITTDNDCEQGGICVSSSHYMVALEQPDASFHLDCGTAGNYGDAGDVYPYGGNRSFTTGTTPSSDRYDGNPSGVAVTNITLGGGVVTMDIVPGKLHDYLVYDDGSCELGWSWGSPGNGFALRVTPHAYPFLLQGIEVFSHNSYSPNFQCQIWDDAGAGGTPGAALTSVHTTTGAVGLSWNYEDFRADSVLVAGGSVWLLYLEYAQSMLGSDTNPPWNGRTMIYWGGNFYADNGAYGNYLMRALGDTALAATEVAEAGPGRGSLRVTAGRPNPFRSFTTLGVSVTGPVRVTAAIYTAAGRRVRGLASEELVVRQRDLVWDGRDDEGRPLPGGIYFCHLRAGGEETMSKIVLLR